MDDLIKNLLALAQAIINLTDSQFVFWAGPRHHVQQAAFGLISKLSAEAEKDTPNFANLYREMAGKLLIATANMSGYENTSNTDDLDHFKEVQQILAKLSKAERGQRFKVPSEKFLIKGRLLSKTVALHAFDALAQAFHAAAKDAEDMSRSASGRHRVATDAAVTS